MKPRSQKATRLLDAEVAVALEDRTRAELRREQVLDIASELFGRKGFDATSMRDIATATGIMSGSLYYHFSSKEEIYIAVMDGSIVKLTEAVEEAIAASSDPFERFEAAAVAHCEALLGSSGFRVLATPMFPPNLAPEVRIQLVAQRDRFEQLMSVVISALPMAGGFDHKIFQKQYLGALNWIPVWYKPGGGFLPCQIAQQFVRTMRGALDTASSWSAEEDSLSIKNCNMGNSNESSCSHQ